MRLSVAGDTNMGSGAWDGRLRGELTEFIGRRAELALVRRALGAARLVTLTGPGGIGKTRLAIEAASGARRAFRDGVWLAELGDLRDPALLVAKVARSLGLSDQSGRWAMVTLVDHLRARQVLLVIDQCEHLADACAVMADALLRACPGLRIMATSRHVLGVCGEVTIAVPPMSVPADCQPAVPADLLRYEAVRLFTDRAADVLPGFTLDAGNSQPVAGVCRRLDGIPLAVELAAVRMRSLSPGQILSRLDSRFPLLSGGGPTDQPHHRTLQGALDWSYDLLTGAEQDMWRRVSVFAGSFDLDAAEAVCAGGVTTEPVVDLVHGLMAKSILSRGTGRGQARYRLLDTIGEFGLCKLRAEGDERELRGRHRDWYAGLAAQQEAFGHRRTEWLDRLDADHENLRGAIEFCLSEPREVAAGAQMACDLWRYWETHGHLTEGRRILAAVLAKLDETAPIRPRALWVAGYLAELQGDILDARARLEAGISAARDTGDIRAIAYASTYLGPVLYSLREPARGHAVTEIALRLHRKNADQLGVALALMRIGFMHLCAGEAREASDRFSECARVSGSSDNVWHHTHAQWGLAVATWLLADHDSAATLASESLRTMRGIDDPIGIALCLDTLGWIAAGSQPRRAVVLLGAADGAWSAFLLALPPAFRERHDAALHGARAALPGSAYRAAFRKGNAMSQAEAIAFALGESPQPAPQSDGTQDGGSLVQLTRREQDVAMLVARGMSNSQIAATALITAQAVIYLLAAHAGLTVNGLSGGILEVLVFGASTDYALLIVARYREELRRHDRRHPAMAEALRRAGPAIIASAATVILALLTLSAAELNSTSEPGAGARDRRRGRHVRHDHLAARPAGDLPPRGLLAVPAHLRLGRADPPGDVGAGRLAHRLPAAAGMDHYRRDPRRAGAGPDRAEGQWPDQRAVLPRASRFGGRRDRARRAFPGGRGRAGHRDRQPNARRPRCGPPSPHTPGIAAVTPPAVRGGYAYLEGTLTAPPDSQAAYDTIDRVRAAVHAVPGANALVGGATAIALDVERASAHDRNLIIPLILAVVLIILMLLLRALVAPLILTATVVLSFAAALGVSAFFFNHVFGFGGADT